MIAAVTLVHGWFRGRDIPRVPVVQATCQICGWTTWGTQFQVGHEVWSHCQLEHRSVEVEG